MFWPSMLKANRHREDAPGLFQTKYFLILIFVFAHKKYTRHGNNYSKRGV